MSESIQPVETEALGIQGDSDRSRVAFLWRAFRDAIGGTQQDFTEGSLARAIALLAIPMVLEMAMESLFGVVDVFFVARLGADAVASVGLTDSLLTIVFTIALGLSMATTAMVARRTGEKNPKGASAAAAQAILIGTVVSIPIGLIGIFYTPALFRLMGASESIVTMGSGYGQLIIGGNVIILLLFLINAVFRGAGDAAIAMRTLWIANLINIVLDPCLIMGLGPFPEMGVTGAAVATNIGRGVGVLYQLYILFSGRGRVRVHAKQLLPDFAIMGRLFRISLGGMFQFLVATASWLALIRIVAEFGGAAIAGYTIAIKVIIFALLPSWGVSNAAATLVGQNLGAGKPDRAERSVWITGLTNMIFLGIVTIVFLVYADELIRLFTVDPAVILIGTDCLRFISYGYVFYAFGMVMVQAFNGAGDTATPICINLACYWLVQIPLAYTLAIPVDLRPRGVFLAITVSESLLAVVGILMFRRGKWKTRQI